MKLTPEAWVEAVRAAPSGPELLAFLRARIARPYEEGPPLDDRRGEGAEDVFEALACDDGSFRLRLEQTIAAYLAGSAANLTLPEESLIVEGMFELVIRLRLTNTYTALRAWFHEHEAALLADKDAVLGRAALGALAMAQTMGSAEARTFWRSTWHNAPRPFQPRAFIGLRLQDPKAAAEELSLLMERLQAHNEDPGPLLHGMWDQPGARAALLGWLDDPENRWASKARAALRRRLPESEQSELKKPSSRPLHSLVSSGAHAWRT